MELARKQFPFFKNNPNLVYLDSAATTQKPGSVLKAMSEFYSRENVNPGRGSYQLSMQAAHRIEAVREQVRGFINARSTEEIIFTPGATESINAVAYSWALHNLSSGDEILVCRQDHKSNVEPWLNIQSILARFGVQIEIVYYELNARGFLFTGDALDDFLANVSTHTKLISLTHVHNIYGVDAISSRQLHQLRDRVAPGVRISLDATQSISHMSIDVQEMGVDFLSFSGHKMFAGMGIGVLYIRQDIRNEVQSYLVGGGEAEPSAVQQFEAGTQNAAAIYSLGAAIDFMNSIGMENIHAHVRDLTQYAISQLQDVEGIEFLPGFALCKCYEGFGIVAFRLEGKNPSDIGSFLEERGVLVRTGSHCSVSGDVASVRMSLHIYSTKGDVDALITAIKQV